MHSVHLAAKSHGCMRVEDPAKYAEIDYCSGGPLPANDGRSHSGHRKDDAAQMSEQIREREQVLETLRRDLDRLLRSPKVA